MKAFTTMARLGLCAAVLAVLGPAQNNKKDDDPAKQAELKKLRAEKVQKEVFGKAKWTFDFDAARAEAKRTGKRIFAYFTRSYAH